ncbi:hypothetical protein AC578_4065 [Pseudocercospora eumusae]|uniref:DASH complex subunit DAD3 n=1 Tax=Pseudocercospora eumusae TaxID=321146 RepID=A0A139HDF5_9PEZI|nr:hypothetical protein AC578_4065 [Pseudocercospora eumusae]KXT00486.1 hypothetical protein AC578_4065 [Pseudocercospora eumusae]
MLVVDWWIKIPATRDLCNAKPLTRLPCLSLSRVSCKFAHDFNEPLHATTLKRRSLRIIMDMDDFNASTSSHRNPEDSLSPLEQEVLDEYAKLVGNLDDLANVLNDLAAKPSTEILDSLRGLERKTATVFTLLKASVYSIVLQQEINEGNE